MNMKKRIQIKNGILKRFFAFLLCLSMIIPAAGFEVYADDAEETEYTYYFPADVPYYEMSMFPYQIKNQQGGMPSAIYRLIDQEGNVWRTYCGNANIYDNGGTNYKIVPLEDSQLIPGDKEKLRAIINNVYPYISYDNMIQNIENSGTLLNEEIIPCYQMALISAVQQAIYSYTNPEVNITNPVLTPFKWDTYLDYKSQIENFDEDFEYFNFDTSSIPSGWGEIYSAMQSDIPHITSWLKSLSGQPAPNVTVDASFEARIETAGDAYNLTLYNLSDDVKNGKDLVVTAGTEDGTEVYSGPAEVQTDGTIFVSFSSDAVNPGDNITVKIEGGKPYEDVVAYESETSDSGEPSSQPFIGKGILFKDFDAQKTVQIPEKVSVPVEKIWADADNTHPDSVTVYLLANGVRTGESLTLTEDNDWTGTFSGLDKTQNGVEIQYTVEEEKVAGYETIISGNVNDGFEVINVSRGSIFIKPADITIYMGGNEGYDAVVGSGSDILDTNNSLPTPLFHIYAPDGVNPEDIRFVSNDIIPGTDMKKEWTVSVAGQTRDGETLYYLNKANEAQDDVRIQYTINGSAVTNDQFDPNDVKDLYEDYTTTLYAGTVATGDVLAIDKNDKDYRISLGEGTLRVRAVENGDGTEESNPVYLVQSELPTERLAAETAAVVAPEGTTYTLNDTTVPAGPDGIGLLFDNIYDKDNGADEREDALIAATDKKIGPAAENVTRWHQAKYLDLVDENDGNAWVKTANGEAVTVVWGYPEGTDENTQFTLLHFQGLHRDDADGANSGYTVNDINSVDPEIINIRTSEAGIEFDVPSGGFSPFVLVWETEGKTGNLTVSKTVAGNAGDKNAEWNFTVTLSDKNINGEYGKLNFQNGVAKFTLKHGESKSGAGLPANVTYEVTETEADKNGYTTTSTGAGGMIEEGRTATAAFTNTKNVKAPADTDSNTSSDNGTSGKTASKSPVTGDDGGYALWIFAIAVSIAAAAGSLSLSRKKKK